MPWSAIISALVSAILGSITKAWAGRNERREMMADAKTLGRLEAENEAFKEAQEARRRHDDIVPDDRAGTVDKLRQGEF